MPSKQIIFADRVVGLTVQGGLVRMDLAVNAGTARDKEGKTAQRMEVTAQVVLPVEAFANAVEMQGKVLKEIATRSARTAPRAPSDASPLEEGQKGAT